MTVLIANPSADVYGSDLQLLQSVSAMCARDWRVVVAVPSDGPLVPRLRDLGAEVVFVRYPVLRRSSASPRGLLTLLGAALGSLPRIRRTIGRVDPCIVYINTVTLPWWLLVARLARKPTICHVHEAESTDPAPVRKALVAPLQLASAIVVNSRATMSVVTDSGPKLRSKVQLVYNGVSAPPREPFVPASGGRWRVVVVGRLSPRKAPHVALEAAAMLRNQGRDVEIDLCGSALEDHRPYLEELRARAANADLEGAVHFSGYTAPIWPSIERAHILAAPSLGESLGNAVIEAQLALRPVVASAVQGHLETVTHEETGLLVPPNDADALATAIERLMDDTGLARRMSAEARRVALDRFSTEGYGEAITTLLTKLAT